MRLLFANRYQLAFLMVVFVIALVAPLPGLFTRSISHDEAFTLLETAGTFEPSWPRQPTRVQIAQKQFEGTPQLSEITKGLREMDIHPPVYYWCLSLWRRWLGFSLANARAFSLLCFVLSVLVLYLLLRVGKIRHAPVCALIYAMCTIGVREAQDARNYSLALVFVLASALFAYLACLRARESIVSAACYAMALALCCGVAFQTNYLALFPVGVIVLWFFVTLWPVSRSIAIIVPIIALSVGAIGASTLFAQASARPEQQAGRLPFVAESQNIVARTLGVVWTPRFMTTHELSHCQGLWVVPVYAGLAALMAVVVVQLMRGSETNRRFWFLLLGLACAPSWGLLLLDLYFNKSLHLIRYLTFATPPLAVMIGYGISTILSRWRVLGLTILAVLLITQMTGIDWGFGDSRRQDELLARNVTGSIQTPLSSSDLVVLPTAGWLIAYVVYDLEPQAMMVVVDNDKKLDEAQFESFSSVWIVFDNNPYWPVKLAYYLEERLTSGEYSETYRAPTAIHLQRFKR